MIGDYVYAGLGVYDWTTGGYVGTNGFSLAAPGADVGGALYVGGAGVTVYDLADPAAPAAVGSFATGHAVRTVVPAGNRAYLASDDGVVVLDVSSPLAPAESGSVPLAAGVPVAASLGEGFLAVATATGLDLLDLADPDAPVVRGHLDSTFVDADAVGALVYLADRDLGTIVVDVSDLDAPRRLGGYDASGVDLTGQAFFGDLLASVSQDGLRMLATQCPGSVPVLISAFDAAWDGDGVRVSWSGSDATAVLRLEGTAAGRTWMVPWRREGSRWTARDDGASLAPGATVLYTLSMQGTDGTWTALARGTVTVPAAVTSLEAAVPNPFNPTTALSYSLAQRGEATLTIYDVAGRAVRQLASGAQEAGAHRVTWDGTDDSGRTVPAGVYFARLATEQALQSRKLTLLK